MIKAKTSAISSQVHTDLIDWKKMKICLMLPELMRAININEVFRGGRACMSMGERERETETEIEADSGVESWPITMK